MPYIHCNMFGTPPVGGEPPWLPYEPLVPWCIEGHEDLWVELKHVPVAVHTFRDQLVQVARNITPDRDGRGHLVVVSGLPGTGKSSLLHRCVHEFVSGLEDPKGGDDDRPDAEPRDESSKPWCRREPSGSVSVVPVTGVRNNGRDLESSPSGHTEAPELGTVIDRIFRTVVKALRKTPGFAEVCGPEIDSNDHFDSWHALTDALAQLGRRLAVIIPHIKWEDQDSRWAFLRFCHQKADRGVVFFVETEYTALEKEIGLIFDETQLRGVTHLKTGRLAPEDWGRYLRLWMELPDIPSPKVDIHEDLLECEPAPWVFVSIAKLQTFLREAADEALQADEAYLRRSRIVLRFAKEEPNPDDFLRGDPSESDDPEEEPSGTAGREPNELPDDEEDRRDEP
ncbi:ATP-binding protein [Streptomyces massasporeus]|uniref:ATP-binding protein n=1 Tax=Streptomyces TaxID=1883 RepID=UPI001C8CC850|nr:ATP-binding protein [Streptomyces sp. WAC04114]MBX9359790.1 ATP-binding protein [Streptomyces sp. WAC04114]